MVHSWGSHAEAVDLWAASGEKELKFGVEL
jgi:hypothetical protein